MCAHRPLLCVVLDSLGAEEPLWFSGCQLRREPDGPTDLVRNGQCTPASAGGPLNQTRRWTASSERWERRGTEYKRTTYPPLYPQRFHQELLKLPFGFCESPSHLQLHTSHLVTCTSGCRSPSIIPLRDPSRRRVPRHDSIQRPCLLLSDSTRSSHPQDSRAGCFVVSGKPPPHGHTVLRVTLSDQLLPRPPDTETRQNGHHNRRPRPWEREPCLHRMLPSRSRSRIPLPPIHRSTSRRRWPTARIRKM